MGNIKKTNMLTEVYHMAKWRCRVSMKTNEMNRMIKIEMRDMKINDK